MFPGQLFSVIKHTFVGRSCALLVAMICFQGQVTQTGLIDAMIEGDNDV
jgi:hypothetical protein